MPSKTKPATSEEVLAVLTKYPYVFSPTEVATRVFWARGGTGDPRIATSLDPDRNNVPVVRADHVRVALKQLCLSGEVASTIGLAARYLGNCWHDPRPNVSYYTLATLAEQARAANHLKAESERRVALLAARLAAKLTDNVTKVMPSFSGCGDEGDVIIVLTAGQAERMIYTN